MLRSIAGPLLTVVVGIAPTAHIALAQSGPPTQPPPAAPAAAASPTAVEEAMAADRLKAMLAADDTAMIVQTFRRHPGAVLPFIDEFLEGGLARIEKSASGTAEERAAALASAMADFRTAVKFAELANQAFGEVIFTEYAGAFGSWSPLEQKRFREGQGAYRAGRQAAKSSAEQAIPLYRRSLALAEALGDHWGVAMSQLAIADACKGLGREANRAQEGHDAAVKAIELFGRLQLKPSYIQALTTCAALRQQMQTPDMGSGQLRMALQALPPDAPAAQRQAIVDELVAILDRLGRKDEVERLKEQERIRSAATP